MKRFRLLLLPVLMLLFSFNAAFCQEEGGIEDDMDDFNSMFEDAEDVSISREQEQQQKPIIGGSAEQTQQRIMFNGSFNASFGGIGEIYPGEDFNPFASFENYFGFTARPADDLSIKGQLYTAFPDFDIEIDELYFDYILENMIYITAGATRTSWGNSAIFDTNILDDEDDSATVDETISVFNTEYVKNRRVDAVFTVPFGRGGQAQFLGMYNTNASDLDSKYLSYAAAVEYPFGPFSVGVFGRRWARADSKRMRAAVGAELTADILNYHVTLWSKIHSPWKGRNDIPYAKFVGGIGRLWDMERMGKIGFVMEYQFTYDAREDKDKVAKTHELGFSWAWRHVAHSDFSPALQWYVNMNEKSGVVIPSLTFSAFSHANITLVAPVIYGGASYTYKTTFTSTKEDPTVLVGLIFSLSTSY